MSNKPCCNYLGAGNGDKECCRVHSLCVRFQAPNCPSAGHTLDFTVRTNAYLEDNLLGTVFTYSGVDDGAEPVEFFINCAPEHGSPWSMTLVHAQPVGDDCTEAGDLTLTATSWSWGPKCPPQMTFTAESMCFKYADGTIFGLCGPVTITVSGPGNCPVTMFRSWAASGSGMGCDPPNIFLPASEKCCLSGIVGIDGCLPPTLYVTLSTDVPNCACLNQTVALHYANDGTLHWDGAVSGCPYPISISFGCVGDIGGMQLCFYCADDPIWCGAPGGAPFDCSTFPLTGSILMPAYNYCCPCIQANIMWTLTE
jgi:hypothetical protein